jgi:hypothetical protein
MTNKVHWSFWVIGIFMLLWNVMGCINFFVQMNPEMLAAYRESEQAMIQIHPLWSTIGFVIAVFGGTLACILLLLKKSIAFYLFVASFIGVVITTLHALTLGVQFEMGELIEIILMSLVVALFLIWYNQYCK